MAGTLFEDKNQFSVIFPATPWPEDLLEHVQPQQPQDVFTLTRGRREEDDLGPPTRKQTQMSTSRCHHQRHHQSW